MATGFMWNDQVVELSGVPEPDEATLNPFGLIGYALVAVITVAATGRLVKHGQGLLYLFGELSELVSKHLNK